MSNMVGNTFDEVVGREMKEVLRCSCDGWDFLLDERVAVRQAVEGLEVKGIVEIFVDSTFCHRIPGEANSNEEQAKHSKLRVKNQDCACMPVTDLMVKGGVALLYHAVEFLMN